MQCPRHCQRYDWSNGLQCRICDYGYTKLREGFCTKDANGETDSFVNIDRNVVRTASIAVVFHRAAVLDIIVVCFSINHELHVFLFI